MKRKDLLLAGAALLAALLLFLAGALLSRGEAAYVVVTVDGREALRAPLSVDERYEFKQEDGSVNVLEVSGGAARMVEANCRDGLCIRQGATRSAAKSIVCLPHKLVVRLESGGEAAQGGDDLDVVI